MSQANKLSKATRLGLKLCTMRYWIKAVAFYIIIFTGLSSWVTNLNALELPAGELAKGPGLPKDVFQFRQLDTGDGKHLLEWIIAPYYYLYLNKFEFKADNPAISFTTNFVGNQQSFDDPFFGELQIFRDFVRVDLLAVSRAGTISDSLATVTYQGCWDGGVCYPPEKISIPLGLLVATAQASVSKQFEANSSLVKQSYAAGGGDLVTDNAASLSVHDLVTNNSDQRDFGNLLESSRLLLLLAFFYLAGLALAFTPCVLPTIPLISGIISRQVGSINSIKGLVMTAVFVLAMSLTYTVAGVVAGMLGQNLQMILQQPWIIVASALIFIFLSGSMFGLYSLQIPAALQNRLYRLSNKHYHGTYFGLAAMGVFSALIVGPCITAPLAGILIYLGGQGDPVLGGVSLFALGIGMGTPLLLVGWFAGSLLPKAGDWMYQVQHFFGFVMLLLSVWILDRILKDDLVLLLYGLVIIASSVYLLQVARKSAEKNNQLGEIIARTCAIVLLVFGVLELVGYSMGSKDVLQPLRDLQANGSVFPKSSTISVRTPRELDNQLAILQQQGKPVLLKYDAEWCIECKIIEREIFSDSEVIDSLRTVGVVTVDVTELNEASDILLKRYSLPGPPAMVFYDAGGERIDLVLIGNITKVKLLQAISQLKPL